MWTKPQIPSCGTLSTTLDAMTNHHLTTELFTPTLAEQIGQTLPFRFVKVCPWRLRPILPDGHSPNWNIVTTFGKWYPLSALPDFGNEDNYCLD